MNRIRKFYKILNVTNEMLHDRGYIIDQRRIVSFQQFGENFSMKKIRKQLNFITKKKDDPTEVISLIFRKELTLKELKKIRKFLNKNECLRCIFVLERDIKLKVENKIKKLSKRGFIFEIFKEEDLTINVTKSKYVSKHILLSDQRKESILKELVSKGLIKNVMQMPKIKFEDPQSRYYGAQRGDLFEIIRSNEISGIGLYYRLVV